MPQPQFIGTVDIGQVREVVQEVVVDEGIPIRDASYRTVMETFAEEIPTAEEAELLQSLDLRALTQIMASDPKQGRDLLRRQRRKG